MGINSGSFNEDLYYAYKNDKFIVIFNPVPYVDGSSSKEIIGKIIALNILENYCKVKTDFGFISFDIRYIKRIEIFD